MAEPGAARPVVAADAEVRRRALAPEVSFLVRAPAGAGKTELLVQRLLTLLARVEEPESVVAVTFTRKAAAEMRARVLAALAAAGAAAPAGAHERHTWELARQARAHAAGRGWNLADAPGRLRITTLDALALTLVGRMPWTARLGAVPQPTDHAERLYQAAARAALARVEEPPPSPDAAAAGTLLALCDGNWRHAEELLAAMLAHRDQWLSAVLQEPRELRAGLEAGFRHQLEADLAAVRAQAAADAACGELVALAAAADPDEDSPLHACRGLQALPPARLEAMPAWLGLTHLAATKSGAPRQRADGRDGLTTKELKARLKELALDERTLASLVSLREFPALPFDEDFWRRLEALLRLLPRAVAELKLQFRASGACDFTEITLAACQALREAGSALAYALDAQLRHLLVDEFQDTSTAHFELLQALVQDWQPGDGRTLFLVGDPMQSIYLFRNARVDLFLRAAQGRLGSVELEVLQLTSNFRSQAGLVEWCNQKFGQIFPASEDAHRGEVKFHPATWVHPAEANAVEPHVASFDHPRHEASMLAEVAAREREADPNASVAVLVHNRAHLREILPALRARGLAFQGVDLFPLDDSPVAEDLLALARAIEDPGDRLAWLALWRAPWCGLTLAELHQLAGGAGEPAGGMPALWAARERALPEAARDRGRRVVEVVGEAAAARGRAPLEALVRWCWQKLGGAECVADAAQAGEVEIILEALQTARGDLDRARTLLQKRYAPAAGGGAGGRLQIMTLHHAKGLEFDVVLLPGLTRQLPPAKTRLLEWMECDAPEAPFSWLLAARSPRGRHDPAPAYLHRRRAAMEEQERTRRLYVAATRARRRLHLFIGLPPLVHGEIWQPHSSTPLRPLWPALRDEVWALYEPPAQPVMEVAAAAGAARAAAAALPPAAGPTTLRRVPDGWQPSPPRPPLAWRAAAAPPPAVGLTASRHAAAVLLRQVGVAVHALLQAMAAQGEPAWTPAQLDLALRRAGVAPEALAAARARARQALTMTLADARGRWILAAHPEARNEWPLTGVVAGRLHRVIVDRSFLEAAGGAEVRWIIDYKNAAHDGGDRDGFLAAQVELYRPQLELYAALAGQLDARPVRCGLYFPLLAAWREVPLPVGE